jgi:integrase
MSSIFTRGNKLWLSFKDQNGKWLQRSTGLNANQKRQATQILKRIEERIDAGKTFDEESLGPVTVRRYFEHWIEERRKIGIRSVDDEKTRLLKHAIPAIGLLQLEEVKPRHVQNLVQELKRSTKLAPRTIHHVYGTLNTMFRDAISDELLSINPCKLKRNDLPKKTDKDAAWRSTAVFTRDELQALIASPTVPLVNRVFYAILFLTGARFGEIAALRWNRYDPKREPLGHLLIAKSWDTKTQEERKLKTEVPRDVPVHPVLSQILHDWYSSGWQKTFERKPEPEDLLVPYPPKQGELSSDQHWRSDTCRKQLHHDCMILGFRHRRTHDTRRTFISLARADGAREDILKWITHGRPGGIMNVYSELPWNVLCEEVSKLNIRFGKKDFYQLEKNAGNTRNRQEVFDSFFTLPANAWNYRGNLVEAAGVEPASESVPR